MGVWGGWGGGLRGNCQSRTILDSRQKMRGGRLSAWYEQNRRRPAVNRNRRDVLEEEAEVVADASMKMVGATAAEVTMTKEGEW